MLFDRLQRQSNQGDRDWESEVKACFWRRETTVAKFPLLPSVHNIWYGMDTPSDHIHERYQR